MFAPPFYNCTVTVLALESALPHATSSLALIFLCPTHAHSVQHCIIALLWPKMFSPRSEIKRAAKKNICHLKTTLYSAPRSLPSAGKRQSSGQWARPKSADPISTRGPKLSPKGGDGLFSIEIPFRIGQHRWETTSLIRELIPDSQRKCLGQVFGMGQLLFSSLSRLAVCLSVSSFYSFLCPAPRVTVDWECWLWWCCQPEATTPLG